MAAPVATVIVGDGPATPPSDVTLAPTVETLRLEAARIRAEVDLPADAVSPDLVVSRIQAALRLEMLATHLLALAADAARYARVRAALVAHCDGRVLVGGQVGWAYAYRVTSTVPLTGAQLDQSLDLVMRAHAAGALGAVPSGVARVELNELAPATGEG